jgi:hypothetical protein
LDFKKLESQPVKTLVSRFQSQDKSAYDASLSRNFTRFTGKKHPIQWAERAVAIEGFQLFISSLSREEEGLLNKFQYNQESLRQDIRSLQAFHQQLDRF